MKKSDRKYIVLLAAVVLLAIVAEALAPEPVDWTPSFEHDDTIPYGSQVLFEILPRLFPDAEVEPVRLPPYERLRNTEDETARTYFFVTSQFAPDDAEAEALYNFVAQGGILFVAAEQFGGWLADTLRLDTDVEFALPGAPGEVEDSSRVNFVSPSLRQAGGFGFRRGLVNSHFARLDTTRAAVLGLDDEDAANFIRVGVGDGAFFLSTLPHVFTNYGLLYGNEEYGYRALSYLPVQPLWWDAHHKPLRGTARTPLRFVLSHPALRWAYFILLAGGVLFILFEAKRRQRVIPVVAPPRNTTVAFAETVGRLYFQTGDHADLAQKKIRHFLDYVRTRLRLPTHRFDEDFIDFTAERAGLPRETIQEVFREVEAIGAKRKVTEAELQRLSTLIDRFYQRSER